MRRPYDIRAEELVWRQNRPTETVCAIAHTIAIPAIFIGIAAIFGADLGVLCLVGGFGLVLGSPAR